MHTSRRTFIKSLALAGAAATLPGCMHHGYVPKNGLFPAAPNFHTSPLASVMISGGTITHNGKFTDAVRAANRRQYGDRKKILLILHATEPDKRDLDERKLKLLFADDQFEAVSLHHWEGDEAMDRIRAAEAFFVGGGETFLLLRTLIETGQLGLIRERVRPACRTTA